MKQNTRKLFSLLLALVMALSLAVPAFAAEGDPPEKELRWVHLDWTEDGKVYARDEVLKDEDHGNSTEYDPSREDAVLFFIWNNKTNKREGYVVPKAGDGLEVEKFPKEGIASGAKQSQYYVTLRMTKFQDSEVTANGLSFPVIAKLGLFGFYSAETPSADTILGSNVAAADLTDGTLYLCAPYMGTDEAAGRGSLTKVEKDPNTPDFNKLFDIESVKEGVWKVTLNDAGKLQLENGGGIWLNLNVEIKDPDGSIHQDSRSINIMGEEQAPQLWFIHLNDEWDDMGNQTFFTGENIWAECRFAQVHTGDYAKYGLFGTIKDGQDPFTDKGFNWDAFTPVDVKDLKAPSGLSLESVSDQAKKGEKFARYFVRVSVAENGKEYPVTSGDYAITIDSGLPEVGVYTAPTASFDTWAGEYEHPYHPAMADNTYYIISAATTDKGNNRRLTGAKLSTANLNDGCGNNLVSLEKVNDNVYKLTLKDLSRARFHVELDLTWEDFMGNTWTDTNSGFGDFYRAPSIVASETKLTDKYDELLPYAEVDGKVSTSVTMNVGEKKDVYLYVTPIRQDEILYRAFNAAFAENYRTNSDALAISFDKDEPAKFTLTATKPGTYEIWLGSMQWDYMGIKLTHADGKAYTEEEKMAWLGSDTFSFYVDDAGKIFVFDADKAMSEAVPFEEYFEGETYEINAVSDEIQDNGWQHLTVTVTGEAKTFVDVTPDDWFYHEVNWAVAKGITNGTSETTFSPDSDCTHAHILTFLWRAAGEPASSTALPFTAKNDWAAAALAWAYEKGMINAQLDEDAPCTSADAVSYIWQAKNKPAATYDGRFTDVAQNAAYAEAVAWAVGAGVTKGTSDTTFAPASVCSRGRIVTFLYRAFAN